MDARAQDVVRRLAEILEMRPEEGYLGLRHGSGIARLHLPEIELSELLRDAGREASEAWGEELSDVEGAARFLSVWLDESLATREAHPTRWWTLIGVGFEPAPPEEAHRRRRDAKGARPA